MTFPSFACAEYAGNYARRRSRLDEITGLDDVRRALRCLPAPEEIDATCGFGERSAWHWLRLPGRQAVGVLAARCLVCLEPAEREAGLRAEGVSDVIIDDLAV